MTTAAWICLWLPFAGALLITLGGTTISRRAAGWISTLTSAAAFAAAVVSFVAMAQRSPENRSEVSTAWNWLVAGNFKVGLSILVDPLSMMMMLIVTGVGSLIVGYSLGYMDGDDEERRYFAYMSLFVWSMLMLVEGGNLLLLLVGWGLVGLSSYLLIGFHHERPSAVAAAKKAFIMNAFGDATMALGLFLLIQKTGTLSFDALSSPKLSSTATTLIALGLLGGAVAKSAQLPLQTWLPDAMEGPTPVSALIHAATMVTAGVYLIVRTHVIFEAAHHVQQLAAGLGTATLVMAGLIALVQTDIKRVIAYSTMSQIGYMFLGAGIGAYSAAMFHLMTHAFFKALLFLGAGIVIHALGGEQDIRRMGGLRRLMPKTWWAMLAGGLALAGLPPLAAFFSKDAILASSLADGTYGKILFVFGMLGTFLTGVYTFRMLFIVFGGEPSAYVREHPPHAERGLVKWSMAIPVGVLTVLAIFGGWIQFADRWTTITDWLDPVAKPLVEASGSQEAFASILAVGLGLLGIGLAWWIYSARRMEAPRSQPVLEHKFWFDELYDRLFYYPADGLARLLGWAVEGPVIRGSLTGLTAGMRGAANGVRQLQTGLVRTYAFGVAAGLAVLVLVFIAVR